jgi:serine/threonine protein kinase
MRGGSYRILEPMGRGGMGALYLAADTGTFDRRCVVKELLDYYDPEDPDEALQAETRFETEARLLASLSHPGIPRIYSYFSEAGRYYIVMEYIEGETLERAVTHVDPLGRTVPARSLSAEEVARHAIRICRVLEYLADQPTPVVHYDIKPANLIVDRTSGEVRLVDFGTARSPTRWATRARLDQAQSREDASAVFGTEGYAAPEQYQGRTDPRSDVYALAATVYHLLTDDDPGEHPFQFPQLESLPGSLADPLSRALRLEVRRRSSATQFRQALEAWLIPEDAAHPFVFRSGVVARTTEELVRLCDRHWPEARQHLADGEFDRWFRERNRHDLVAKAQSARLETDDDAALETFLRRLDPRLPLPRLAVEPQDLDFGRVARSLEQGGPGGENVRHLVVRNEGRGYGQARLQPSVSWLRPEPDHIGCLAGSEASVRVCVDTAVLPLRRDHQAIIHCTPARGARIPIGVRVQLSLTREALGRMAAVLRRLLGMVARAARRGLILWTRIFRSMLRSRFGAWVILGEVLLLAVAMVVLWWTWESQAPQLSGLVLSFLQALPLALLAVYLLPALACVVGTIAWEAVGVAFGKLRDLGG